MPAQRALWREMFPKHPLSSFDEWQEVVLELWRTASYREERYAAIALADWRPYAGNLTYAAVPMLEEMIVSGAWWDYVDWLATHCLGTVIVHERDARKAARIHALMRRWARDSHLWKRRAAILCQIRFKRNTDLELLYACLEPNLADRDFFIRKAIGWALRSYAWTDPREVRRYVRENGDRLSPLSVREALKNADRK